MKRLLFILLLTAACTPQERAKEDYRIRQLLPEGCELFDLGEYRQLEQLVVVTCDDRKVTTSSSYNRRGKNSRDRMAAVVIQ